MILYHKDKVITFNTINYMLKINPPNKTTNDFTTISITVKHLYNISANAINLNFNLNI